MDMNGINGYAVWYRLEVAVHNYSYLIIQINNYNKLPTFLMYVILVYMYNVYLSQRRTSSYLDGCRIFVVRVNLLVLTRPTLAINYPNGNVDFFHVHFVILIVLVINKILFRSNCTFYLSSLCISVLVLLLLKVVHDKVIALLLKNAKSLFSQLTTASHHYKTSFDMAIVEIHAVVS